MKNKNSKKVATMKEMKAFVAWLANPKKESERKAAYNEFFKDEEATPEQWPARKAAFIQSRVGEFMEKEFNRLHVHMGALLGEGLHDVDYSGAENKRKRNELNDFQAVLGDLQKAISTEVFEKSFSGPVAHIDAGALQELAKAGKIQGNFVQRMAHILGAREHANALLKDYLEDPNSRKDVTQSFKESRPLLNEKKTSNLQVLFHFIRNSANPSERAELLGKIVAYHKSGWAEADLVQCSTHGNTKAKSLHEKLDEFTEKYNKSGNRDPKMGDANKNEALAKGILESFQARFNDLAYSIKIVQGEDGARQARVTPMSELKKSTDRGLAASGEVDIAIPKYQDPSVRAGQRSWLLVDCTSDEKLREDSSFWRHGKAFRKYVQKRGESYDYIILRPCLIYAKKVSSKGRKLLGTLFENAPKKPHEFPPLVDAINMLPIVHEILRGLPDEPELGSELFSRVVEVSNVGSRESGWDGIRNALLGARSTEEKNLLMLDFCANQLGTVSDYMCDPKKYAAPNKKMVLYEGESEKAANFGNMLYGIFSGIVTTLDTMGAGETASVKATKQELCTKVKKINEQMLTLLSPEDGFFESRSKHQDLKRKMGTLVELEKESAPSAGKRGRSPR